MSLRAALPRLATRGMCATAQQTDGEKLALIQRGISPATGKPLSELAASLWRHTPSPAGPGNRSGQRYLRRPLKGPLYVAWYPPSPTSYSLNPLRKTEKQERWLAKLAMLRAAGKGPPKKGAGKRSK